MSLSQMPNIHFIPECYAETELVKALFDDHEGDYFNHAEGIHGVSKILKNKDVPQYVNIGFVDSDKKNIPPYFDEFETIDQIPSVIFKKHPQTDDFIIISCPAIESFILAQLEEIKKHPSDYGLPNDLKAFCKKLKKRHIKNDEGYKRMLLDLKESGTSGIVFMKEKISQLRA
jgi:hypothetical protein